ncbi:Transcriptional regulator, GntR family [Candidatus Rhodobacter oscarellae]|uniref:Transcriptional regulator, GntR family n=1 Tax=Candidatus Rhodobacter oscarellae TaxID=1675527 RepID=A0A0J9E3Z3_9RHOB|nr:Transcriptional regulator, GntR family [Candidatus Rhodobacter lobularis]
MPDIYLAELPTGAGKTAVNTLGRMIARGDFPAGATIPMEAELVGMLGVSRTVVREAIKVLSGKGMVRTARRYGTRVLPFESWNLIDPDVINWHEPSSPAATKIYRDSTKLRFIFEPEAAALAAINATTEQREIILRAAEHIRPEPYGTEGMIAADYAFHATILESTGNIMLRQMQGLILALLQFSYPTGAQAAPSEKVSRRSHIEVAEAIKAGDGETARARMSSMLEQNQLVADRIGAWDGPNIRAL